MTEPTSDSNTLEASAASLPKTSEVLAHRGRRVVANVIDSLLLVSIGYGLGTLLSEAFSSMMGWEILIGFSVTLLFYAIPESNLMHGQSFGKRLLRVKVVNKNLEVPSFPVALVRTAIFFSPVYLIPITELLIEVSGITGTIFRTLSVSLYLIFFYLFIFNSKTKQSIHEVFTSTYVVNENARSFSPEIPWKGHYMASFVLFILAGFISHGSGAYIDKDTKAATPIKQACKESPDISFVSFSMGLAIDRENNYSYPDTFYIHLRVAQPELLNRDVAVSFIDEVIEQYANYADVTRIKVTLHYGYDIGIMAESTERSFDQNFSFSDYFKQK